MYTPERSYDFTNPFDVAESQGMLVNQREWDAQNFATSFNRDLGNYRDSFYNPFSENLRADLSAFDDSLNFENVYDTETGLPDNTQNLVTGDYSWGLSGLDEDFGNYVDLASEINDFSSTYDPFEDSDLTLEEAGIINDLQELDEIEVGALSDIGLISYDEDGNLNTFDTNTAIVGIENALIQNKDDMDVDTYQTLLSTRNELIGAVDAGIDAITVRDTLDYEGPSLPLDAKKVNSITGGYKWISPSQSDFGTRINTNGSDDPLYASAKFLPNRPTQDMGGGLGGMNNTSNAMAEERAGIRQQFADTYKGDERTNMYNEFSYYGPTPAQQTFNTKFDSFTDQVADGVSWVLQPIDWVADGVGNVFSKAGQVIGDNVIGNGLNDFGNWLDRTGDVITEDIPGRIINAPDNLVDFGSGLYRWATGSPDPLGQPQAVDLMKESAIGLVKTPFQLLGDVASVPLSLMKDVFGIDEISIGVGGSSRGGGGGGRGKTKKKTARKNRPIVGNKRNANNGVPVAGGRSTGVGQNAEGEQGSQGGYADVDGYDLNTTEGRNDYADQYGEAALAGRLGDMNLNLSGATGVADAGTIEASEADTSQVAKSISENQGGGAVKKAKPVDALDTMVGPGPEVEQTDSDVNDLSGVYMGDVFNNEETPVFAYEEEEEAFA